VKTCLFECINCEGEAFTSAYFSKYAVKSTWWWPKTAETCGSWQM